MNKIFTTLSILFLANTLVACTQLSTSTPSSPQIPVVVDPSLADITSVQESYISANGQDCQKVQSDAGIELRCFDGLRWQLVPSIYK